MKVVRIGLAVLKGARHESLPSVTLAPAGPVGDREFCFVDPARARVLRTIENAWLLDLRATWDGEVLTVWVGLRRFGVRVVSGAPVKADYWGRQVGLHVVPADELVAEVSALAGRPVVLTRAGAGDVVYAGAISIVGTAELDELSQRLGEPVDPARFRSTFVIEGEVERPGAVLSLGDARVRIRGPIARCAVIDLSAADSPRALLALAEYRRSRGEIWFGVDADVLTPGVVRFGDRAVWD